MGRRSLFFFALTLLSLVMIIPTPAKYRWVNLFAAGLALFWGVLLLLERRSLAKARSHAKHTTRPRDVTAE